LVVIGITAAILLLSALQVTSARLNPRSEDAASIIGTIVGKYISSAWPAGSLVALNTAGSTPYHARQNRYIDMLGLNDTHIARRRIDRMEMPLQRIPGHLKGDGAYVLSRSPDFIILGPAEGSTASEPWFLSDLEIARDPRFAERYEMHQAMLGRDGETVERGGLVFTYFRKLSTASGSSQ
jgi:hypothetical protein